MLTANDCDDNDASLGDIADDADCDGTLTADDCDDDDPSVSAPVDEILDDGIDQDCNGYDAITCYGDYDYIDAEHCAIITGDLNVSNTASISLELLHTLQEVAGGIQFYNNTVLTSFSSMDKLTSVGSFLWIGHNNPLETFTLDQLTYVGGDLSVFRNTALTSFSMASLTKVDGQFWIDDHSFIESISLDALEEINGNFWIRKNDALTSFSVDNLTYVAGNLSVYLNAILTTFSMDSLTTVGEGFDLEAHWLLTSFSLASLTDVGQHETIQIENNKVLCQSMVLDLVDTLTAMGWAGTSWLRNNDESC